MGMFSKTPEARIWKEDAKNSLKRYNCHTRTPVFSTAGDMLWLEQISYVILKASWMMRRSRKAWLNIRIWASISSLVIIVSHTICSGSVCLTASSTWRGVELGNVINWRILLVSESVAVSFAFAFLVPLNSPRDDDCSILWFLLCPRILVGLIVGI